MSNPLFGRKHTPRWIIFIIDICICLCSLIIAYLLRFNFDIPDKEIAALRYIIPGVFGIRAGSFAVSRIYANIVRFTSTKDAERILLVVFVGSLIFVLLNIVFYYFIEAKYFIPFSIIIIDFFITVFFMMAFRIFIKTLYLEMSSSKQERKNVIIFGTGEFGVITKRTLERDVGTNFRIQAFVDNSSRNVGQKLEGVSIYNLDKLETLMEKKDISTLIFAKDSIRPSVKNQIIDTCLANDVKVLSIPPVHSWINGELSFNQIKKVKIEDLLERAPIQLDEKQIKKQIAGRRVLVTGAAGSIGSELVRQLIRFIPAQIILLDNAESPLYDIELELIEKFRCKNAEVVIGDITDRNRMVKVFETFKPQIIYHAAAYKHVPMMEVNPGEAIRVNVMGTMIVSELACKYESEMFVMISTDKAVNPTNVMGASKRIAEIFIQSLNRGNSTKFVTTRFGNVLGSNGSVIPRFRKQIQDGGPVTITHPEITRYFMTIPEACQLVLEAGSIGHGGEVFIFDMGESVKIVDLAKKMIRLSGLELGKDIHIVFTGLRPGEKLYEELLFDKENSLPTHHEQILIAKVMEYDQSFVKDKCEKLISSLLNHSNKETVGLMKDLVPEFKSKNSEFEILDVENG